MDGLEIALADRPVIKVRAVFLEQVAEELLLAFQKGIIVGVGKSEVQIRLGLVIHHAVDEGVVLGRERDALELGKVLEDRLEIDLEIGGKMVGGELSGVQLEGNDRRIGHLAQGAGFLPILNAGDGKTGFDVPEERTA